MKKILVLCTGNSCRSQMAEGYLRFFAKGKAEVFSAGIETHGVNPKAIAIMKEDGIDISHHASTHIDDYQGIVFDYVITVCDHAQEHCPFFSGKALRLHQNFADPSKLKGTEEEVHEAFEKTRELIKAYCDAFIREYIL
jgi:arsenate reductase